MSKEKNVIIHMLEMYRDMPFLWDKNHENYVNRESRNNGYQVLLKVYKQIDQNATVKTLTKKIQNLRTNYSKELKKIQDSKRNGEKIYTPTLWYFNTLSFLENYNDPCPASFTTEMEDTAASSEADSEYPRTSQNYIIPPVKKKKIVSLPQRQDNNTMDTTEKCSKLKEGEWEILGKSIGIQLRDLNQKQLTITQKIISDAIYYAKIGVLSENSFIALGPSNTHTYHPSTSQYAHTYQNQLPEHLRHSPSSSSSPNAYYADPKFLSMHISTSPRGLQSYQQLNNIRSPSPHNMQLRGSSTSHTSSPSAIPAELHETAPVKLELLECEPTEFQQPSSYNNCRK